MIEVKIAYLKEFEIKRLSAPSEADLLSRRLFFARWIHLPAAIYFPVYRVARHTSI